MLTKNFYNWVMANLTKREITNGYVTPDGKVYNAVRSTQPISYMWEHMDYLVIDNAPTNYLYVGVRIGTGVTPATADDYTLESVINSGLSVVNPQDVTVTRENDFVAVYATYTVTNNGTTAVAISEIGLFCAGVYTSSTMVPILADRTVLESPITINPGEAKPITYTIRFNYPTEV